MDELEEQRKQAKEAAKTPIAAVINMGWLGALGDLPGSNYTKPEVPRKVQRDRLKAAEEKRQRRRERNLRNLK